MLCSHGLCPPLDVHWPGLHLFPQVTPLFYQQDQMLTNLQQLRSHLELMKPVQHKSVEQMGPLQTSGALKPVSCQLTTDEQHFGLSLDTGSFSPEELSVRQVGRKLRVSGKMEKKQDDTKGSYYYKCQEFRQELELPEGVNPETLTCYLSPDGKLHIQADKASCIEEAERELPIIWSSEEQTQTDGGSSTKTTQDARHTMD